jgi:hypothetical protein
MPWRSQYEKPQNFHMPWRPQYEKPRSFTFPYRHRAPPPPRIPDEIEDFDELSTAEQDRIRRKLEMWC